MGEDAQRLLRLLNALSIDLENFDQNQLVAKALREKWVNEKLKKANINNIKQEAQ